MRDIDVEKDGDHGPAIGACFQSLLPAKLSKGRCRNEAEEGKTFAGPLGAGAFAAVAPPKVLADIRYLRDAAEGNRGRFSCAGS